MFGLPKPTTFEDGLRQLFSIGMVAAGVFAGLMSVGMVGLFYYVGTKNPPMMELCLKILAGGFAGFLASMIIVIVSMSIGGPVGRFKVHASKDGLDLEASGDGEAPAPVVMTQTIAVSEGPVIE